MTTRRLATPLLAVIAAALLSGCLYGRQRADDLLDVLDLGAGITAESEHSWIPPTLGVLAEAGPFALGAITHNGLVAEIDGRGLYAGPDHRARLAAIWFQGWSRTQDYDNGATGYYKDEDASSAWHERMRDMSYTKFLFHPGTEVSAKNLLHDDAWTWEALPLRRGWQYWETIAVEAGLSDPFLTHMGFYLRIGVDPSEILDFLLGIVTVDLKRDDMTEDEYMANQ